VSRALRALSSAYVERRHRLGRGAALDGAGKRAAFALFYGPLHFLLVREIVRALPDARPRRGTIVDLGCGTGVAGAAWGSSEPRATSEPRGTVVAIDRHPWALAEATWTYQQFRLSARTRQGDISTAPLPKPPCDIVAAFAVNELPDADRDALLTRLIERTARGDRLMVIEPLAKSASPWWSAWADRIVTAGGRADEWRVRVELPAIVAKLDRAAGLRHGEVTGRSLWLSRTALPTGRMGGGEQRQQRVT
jgi:hypothetical protein